MNATVTRKFALRLLNCFVSMIMVFYAFGTVGLGNAHAQGVTELNRMFVDVDSDQVSATYWPAGVPLTLTVSDDNGLVYQTTQVTQPMPNGSGYGSTVFNLWPLPIDLVPGQYASVTDGTTTQTTQIVNGTFDFVDPEQDIASGTGPAGRSAQVVVKTGLNEYSLDITIGPNGTWTADFGAAHMDIGYVDWATIDIWDVGIVSTVIHLPYPITFGVYPEGDTIEGWEWPEGATVNINVDRPSTPGPDLATTVVSERVPGDPGHTLFELNNIGYDIKVDDIVTLSSGATTKQHTIRNLSVTGFDVDAETISGTADAGQQVFFTACSDDQCAFREETTGSYGSWKARFKEPGNLFWEQDLLDIRPGSWINASIRDDDGDITEVGRHIPNPSFSAQANNDYIEGYEWPVGVTINLEIDDPTSGMNPDYTGSTTVAAVEWDPNQTWWNFQLDSYDLKVGDILTVSDGIFTKQLTLANVTITEVDLYADIVHGTADSNQPVSISACGDGFCFFRDEVADSSGNWSANFAVSSNGPDDTLDLQSGLGINAFIWDQDGDQSSFGLTADWVPPASIPLVFAISSPVDLRVPVATVENISVLNTLNESLFMLDKDNRLVPLAAAAEPVVSPDGLTYTVTLRPGAVWSDGEPVTAEHFVDGILRVLDPNVGSDYGFLLLAIKNAKAFNDGTLTDPAQVGIKALNAQTLEITLAQRTAHFPNVLASPAILPARQDVIDDFGDSWTSPAHYVSSGPYKLLEYDSGHIVVEQNPLYNGPIQTVFSQIAFDVIPDPDQQVAAYKNGDVDVLIGTPLATIMNDEALRQNLTVLPSPGVQYIGFTAQVSPTGNPLVRKALASAIDRQALIDNVLQASWRVEATGVIPPELTGYQGSEVGYIYDVTQAQSFLAQAGYPGGVGFPPLEIMSGPNQAAVIEELATQWETVLGITVNIHYLSGGERFQALTECQQNPSNCSYNAYLSGWFIDYPDAYNILNDLFHPDSPYNYTGWDNPIYRNLIDLAVSELDPAQRTADLQQAEQLLVEGEAAVAPLFHTDYVMVVRPGIFPYYSPTFFANLAYWSNVDPNGDGMGAAVIGSEGGIVATENDTVSAEIPAGALDEDVTLSITDLGGNYQITASEEPLNVITAYSIQPHGLQFATPVTLTFAWNDVDNNGQVDGTDWSELNIVLIKDGEPISQSCDVNPNCDRVANVLTVEVSSLSHFELSVPFDTTPPTITWSGSIQEGNNFYFGFVPPAPTCSASDTPSGVDGACTVSGYASTPGTHTLTATATDHAGNVATETRHYTVLAWTLNGFYQPVDMNGVYNLVKGGSTVPVKFEIFAGPTELTSTDSIRSFSYAQMACEANAIIAPIEVTVANGSGLHYDSTTGQFIYNWKTPSNTGKCYRLTMTTMDGSLLTAFFKLK